MENPFHPNVEDQMEHLYYLSCQAEILFINPHGKINEYILYFLKQNDI